MKEFLWIAIIITLIAGVCAIAWFGFIERMPVWELLIFECIWVFALYCMSTWVEDGE